MLESRTRGWAKFQSAIKDFISQSDHLGAESTTSTPSAVTGARLWTNETTEERVLVTCDKIDLAGGDSWEGTDPTENISDESPGRFKQLERYNAKVDRAVERKAKRYRPTYAITIQAPGRCESAKKYGHWIWEALLGSIPPTCTDQIELGHPDQRTANFESGADTEAEWASESLARSDQQWKGVDCAQTSEGLVLSAYCFTIEADRGHDQGWVRTQ